MKKVASSQASSPLDNIMEEFHSFSTVAGFACFQHVDTGTLVHLYVCPFIHVNFQLLIFHGNHNEETHLPPFSGELLFSKLSIPSGT